MKTCICVNGPETSCPVCKGYSSSTLLHAATDELNTALKDFEQTLLNLRLGVSAAVRVPLSENEYFVTMEFAKVAGTFQLFIRLTDDERVTSITSAAREIRVACVPYLRKLYTELLFNVTQDRMAVEAAVIEVRKLISDIAQPRDDLKEAAKRLGRSIEESK